MVDHDVPAKDNDRSSWLHVGKTRAHQPQRGRSCNASVSHPNQLPRLVVDTGAKHSRRPPLDSRFQQKAGAIGIKIEPLIGFCRGTDIGLQRDRDRAT